MTLPDLLKTCKTGDAIGRHHSLRTFFIGNSKEPKLLVNHTQMSASFWTDDLTANDWYKHEKEQDHAETD